MPTMITSASRYKSVADDESKKRGCATRRLTKIEIGDFTTMGDTFWSKQCHGKDEKSEFLDQTLGNKTGTRVHLEKVMCMVSSAVVNKLCAGAKHSNGGDSIRDMLKSLEFKGCRTQSYFLESID